MIEKAGSVNAFFLFFGVIFHWRNTAVTLIDSGRCGVWAAGCGLLDAGCYRDSKVAVTLLLVAEIARCLDDQLADD